MREIYYYYSIRSDFTYLGAARIAALAEQHGRRLVHRPIKLSVTMGPIGGIPFDQRPPLRTAYSHRDAARWAEHLGIPCLEDPIHHDGPMELPSGAVIAAQRAVARGEAGDLDELHRLILEALWRDDRDIAHQRVMAELMTQAGFEPSRLIPAALSDEVQLELARNCREAIVRGVLGAPTYLVDGENFFGQDRLDFVARWLAKAG